MTDGHFPDVEVVVGDVLASLTDGRINDATPSNLEALADFQRVQRVGGADDGVTDSAVVDVEAFAPTRQAAFELARAQGEALRPGRHAANGVLLDKVSTISAPARRPWDNEDVHRFGATYRITARRS